jgi:hypothetical protein
MNFGDDHVSPALSSQYYRSNFVMARRFSRERRFKVQASDIGMARFFSPANLDRYRKLASGAVGDTERHQIMKDLAKEMQSFRCEARLAAGDRQRNG